MGPIIALFSIFFAAFPLLVVAIVIWSADVYNRKPVWTGLVALFWGAFVATTSAIVISGIAHLILNNILRVGAQQAENIQTVIVAPTMEEITKGLILIILMFVPRGFESGTNGLVLGAMAGFGFAITENFLYYINVYMASGVESWIVTIIVRTLFSTFIHVMASGIIGFALGLGASRGHHPIEIPILLIIGYTLAVTIHMSWNLSATLSEQVDFGFMLLGFMAFFIAAFLMLCLGLVSVYLDRKILEREFEDEIQHGVLTLEDTFILTRWTRRNALKFIFPGKLSGAFQKAALRLAVIKHQNRTYRKNRRDREIESLRGEIMEMKNYSMVKENRQTLNQPGTNPFAGQNSYGQPQAPPRRQSLSNGPAGYRPRDAATPPPTNPYPPQESIPGQEEEAPYYGMGNLPQRAPRFESPDQQEPPAPHSVRIINPAEFRRRVRKEKGLEQESDFEREMNKLLDQNEQSSDQ